MNKWKDMGWESMADKEATKTEMLKLANKLKTTRRNGSYLRRGKNVEEKT